MAMALVRVLIISTVPVVSPAAIVETIPDYKP
jgi:hypothetical protein